MITCYLRYVIDPFKLKEFEHYAKLWIPSWKNSVVNITGTLMPHEGANDIALALFSFPSLADYEQYRAKAADDPDCQAAMKYSAETKCLLSFERTFMRPVFK